MHVALWGSYFLLGPYQMVDEAKLLSVPEFQTDLSADTWGIERSLVQS